MNFISAYELKSLYFKQSIAHYAPKNGFEKQTNGKKRQSYFRKGQNSRMINSKFKGVSSAYSVLIFLP